MAGTERTLTDTRALSPGTDIDQSESSERCTHEPQPSASTSRVSTWGTSTDQDDPNAIETTWIVLLEIYQHLSGGLDISAVTHEERGCYWSTDWRESVCGSSDRRIGPAPGALAG